MRRERKGEESERATSDERTNERTNGGEWALGAGHWALDTGHWRPKCATRTYAGDGRDKRDFSHSTREAMDCGLWIMDCGFWWIVDCPGSKIDQSGLDHLRCAAIHGCPAVRHRGEGVVSCLWFRVKSAFLWSLFPFSFYISFSFSFLYPLSIFFSFFPLFISPFTLCLRYSILAVFFTAACYYYYIIYRKSLITDMLFRLIPV